VRSSYLSVSDKQYIHPSCILSSRNLGNISLGVWSQLKESGKRLEGNNLGN